MISAKEIQCTLITSENRNKGNMLKCFRSASPSPCPSPVGDLVANFRLVSSLKRDKYKTMIESQPAIISKGRMTMTGGFQDFRRHPYSSGKNDSLELDTCTLSRSDSCDSTNPIADANIGMAKLQQRRFVKIPQKALKDVINQLSPHLSKKLTQQDKKCSSMTSFSQHPMWPNVMTTYARGVSTTSSQLFMTSAQPGLNGMNAHIHSDDIKCIRMALKMLAKDISREVQLNTSSHSLSSNSDRDAHGASLPRENLRGNWYETADDDTGQNSMQLHLHTPDSLSGGEGFPINPQIKGEPPGVPDTNNTPGNEDDFQVSVFDVLDLDSVLALSPEELTEQEVLEVRNVHLCREYIILETFPPTESVFV